MPFSTLISTDTALRLLFALGLAGVIFAFGWDKGRQSVQHKWDAEKTNQQAAVIADQKQTISSDRATRQVEVNVDEQTNHSLHQLSLERDSLRSALVGMRQHRDELRALAASETSTRAFLAENLANTANSLSECSERYSEVAKAHDVLSVQVTGLLEIDARNLALSKTGE